MKKSILMFILAMIAMTTDAQIKMHDNGWITFQTVLNSTTQGISFGPPPNYNANFNGPAYFKKEVYFLKNTPEYQWVNCVKVASPHAAAWVVACPDWDSLNFYVYAKGDAYAMAHFTISNNSGNGGGSKGGVESIDGQEALSVVNGLTGFYFAPENGDIPELEGNDFVDPQAVDAMYADFSKRSVGLAGDNVEEVFPEAVRTDPKNRYCINYQSVVTMLVEAVKEQQREIEELRQVLKENGLTK